MNKSTKPKKPAKPHRDYPLYAHPSGQWAKTIRGRKHYFGPWDDPDGALQRYLDQKDDLLAGRKPRAKRDGLTVEELINRFLEWKESLLDSGELEPGTFRRYKHTGLFLAGALAKTRLVEDLAPDDFQRLRAKMARKWGPVALANEIQTIRSMFTFAYENDLIDRPVKYGSRFNKPSERVLRKNRTAKGPKMFEADELRRLLKHCTTNMKAMVLLGINGGLGNTEVGLLPIKAVDLDAGWIDYPRSKTGMPRRIPLWPETVKTLRDALEARTEPNSRESSHLFFIGPRGEDYVGNHKGYRVTQEMKRCVDNAEIGHRTFYDLRRTFETIGENSHDLVAVKAIMGHAPAAGDMSARYRQRVDDDRLWRVVNIVRAWLFDEEPDEDRDQGDRSQDQPPRLRIIG